jgi:hypothetical protein
MVLKMPQKHADMVNDKQYIDDLLCWTSTRKHDDGRRNETLIQISTTLDRATQTWDLVLFNGEMIILGRNDKSTIAVDIPTMPETYRM